jgi:hypothetical protein
MFSTYNTKLAASSPELHEAANIEVKLVVPRGERARVQIAPDIWTVQKKKNSNIPMQL